VPMLGGVKLDMKRFGLTSGYLLVLTIGAYFICGPSPLRLAVVQDDRVLAQSASDATDEHEFPRIFVRDPVVSNTDSSLKNTDMLLNAEPGIAVNPTDPRKIAVSAFSGAWSTSGTSGGFMNAPIWYTTNGGRLWTKQFTIPAPPGVPSVPVMESPCDETFEYGRNGNLYGTFLFNGQGEEGANCSELSPPGQPAGATFAAVYSGGTTDPANAQAWRWYVINGTTQPTTQFSPDQPWLIVNKDPTRTGDENVYVAYQASPMLQVAVARATVPPNFTIDNSTGTKAEFGVNAGHRIAADQSSGAVYSLYQAPAGITCPNPTTAISYMLNRSTDGGLTWELNGQGNGIAAAVACSSQLAGSYAFGQASPDQITGGVNPLLGGVDALAVDSSTGAVYVVYGDFDQSVGRDRISIVQLTVGQNGELTAGTPHFVSDTMHQSALPAVAVARNHKGTVAVLYDTADRLDPETLRPYFSVHLALSQDHGATFTDTKLQEFLFPPITSGGFGGPRPLGDFQQLKAEGRTFYGVFSGDGEPFGRPFHKIDPIFFKTSVK
jgi:hypothetical protein